MDCDQTCKDIAFNTRWKRVCHLFGFGDFDPIFKVMLADFFLK